MPICSKAVAALLSMGVGMNKSVAFTEGELHALDDAVDTGLSHLRAQVSSADTDSAKQVLASSVNVLLGARAKIREARAAGRPDL
jgi:hypothetical protein